MSLNLRIAKLGSAIDSATTGHFLSKGATDAVFQAVSSGGLDSAAVTTLIDSAYIQARQTDIYRDSAFITNLVDSAYIQLRDRFQDSSGITAIVDSAYVQARQTSVGSGGLDSAATISLINNNTNSGFFKYKYTATSGQTVFADSDANGNVMSFDPNSTLVFYNGVLLDETTDYEASSNTVTLTSGADAGVSITVAKYGVGYIPPARLFVGNRGIVPGGEVNQSMSPSIEYFNISTPGNASSFGTLTTRPSSEYQLAGCGDGTYGLSGGGGTYQNPSNIIDYITIATPGNAQDFGDLTVGRYTLAAVGDDTYGIFAGGYAATAANVIDYVTVRTNGNATDFGDFLVAPSGFSGGSNSTYGIFNYNAELEYITKATPSNASDFGDIHHSGGSYRDIVSSESVMLIAGGRNLAGESYGDEIYYVSYSTPGNAVDWGYNLSLGKAYCKGTENNDDRGVFVGGVTRNGAVITNGTNTIEYVTISVPSNATDFGDLVGTRTRCHCYSGT